MKCDELKPLVFSINDLAYVDEIHAKKNFDNIHDHAVYKATKVDAAIAELKAIVTTDNSAVIARLEEQLRKTQRALWLARANRAKAEWGHWATIWFCNTSAVLNINKSSVSQDSYRCTIQRNAAIWRNMWSEVERKCRAKAEEYK